MEKAKRVKAVGNHNLAFWFRIIYLFIWSILLLTTLLTVRFQMSPRTKLITIVSRNLLGILIGIIVATLTFGFFTVIHLWVRRNNLFIQTYPLKFVLGAKFIILSIPAVLPFMFPTLIGFAIYGFISVKYLQTYVNGVML